MFGNSAMSFDGAGDYLEIPDSDDWDFGSGDFVIDGWVKFETDPSNTSTFIAYDDGSTNRNWNFRISSGTHLQFAAKSSGGSFNDILAAGAFNPVV